MKEYDFTCEYCEGTGKGYVIETSGTIEVKCWHCNDEELEIEAIKELGREE